MIEILTAIGLPVLRSVGGWMTYALKDGSISKFEKKKLIETVVSTGVIGTMIYFGADGLGIDITAIGSSAAAVVVDMITKNLKK